MQAGPALRNFAGEHFPLLASRPCFFNLLVVLRLDSDLTGAMPSFWHYKVLTIMSVDLCTIFLCLQPANFYGFTELSLWCEICCRFATLLYTNCPGRPPKTGNTLAITYHVHVPHVHWPSLGFTATATAVAWTVTEVRVVGEGLALCWSAPVCVCMCVTCASLRPENQHEMHLTERVQKGYRCSRQSSGFQDVLCQISGCHPWFPPGSRTFSKNGLQRLMIKAACQQMDLGTSNPKRFLTSIHP